MNKRKKTTPQHTATGVGSDASQGTLQASAGRSGSITHTDSVHHGGNWSKEIEATSSKDRSVQTGLTTVGESLSLTTSSKAAKPASSWANLRLPPSVDGAKDEKSATSTGTVSEEILTNVNRIRAMGFSEESTIVALEICANNPDRAVEYLLNESVDESSASAGGGGGTTGDGSSLAVLRENPFFGKMMYQMREQPDRLPMLLNMFKYRYPQYMRIIADNPKEFLKLSKDAPGTAPISLPLWQSLTTEAVGSVSPNGSTAIDRLKALGYPEHRVNEAYEACGYDEQKAADFLFSQARGDGE